MQEHEDTSADQSLEPPVKTPTRTRSRAPATFVCACCGKEADVADCACYTAAGGCMCRTCAAAINAGVCRC